MIQIIEYVQGLWFLLCVWWCGRLLSNIYDISLFILWQFMLKYNCQSGNYEYRMGKCEPTAMKLIIIINMSNFIKGHIHEIIIDIQ